MSAIFATGSGVRKMAVNHMFHRKNDNKKAKRRMVSNHLPLFLLFFEESSEYAVFGQTPSISIFF